MCYVGVDRDKITQQMWTFLYTVSVGEKNVPYGVRVHGTG